MSKNKSNGNDLQLKKLLDKLEKRRKDLNKAAEEEFLAGRGLSTVLAREEHEAFQQASQEYEDYLKQDNDDEKNQNK